MITKTTRVTLLAALASAALSSAPAQAQVSIGADIVSRYVWRGLDFGDTWTIQPSLSFAGNGFEVGAWASYGVHSVRGATNENDLYVSYTYETESGTALSFGVTDYYFPDSGGNNKFFATGAHSLEPFVSLSGPESFPVDGLLAIVFAPDGDDSREQTVYAELGVPFSKGGADLRLHVGAVGGASEFYLTSEGGVVTMGVSASKSIAAGESFELPVSASYVLNPATEQSFLVFGLTLSP